MDDRALVEKLRVLSLNPKRRTSMAKAGLTSPAPFPPAAPSVVAEAEQRLGFALPPFLRTLYLEVGNGGFGPGCGLWGLAGGHAVWDPWGPDGADIVEAHLTGLAELGSRGLTPPGRRLPLCDWGCCNGSVLDCATPEGEVIFIQDGLCEVNEGALRQYILDWAKGVDLWSRANEKKGQHPSWMDTTAR